MKVLQEVVGVVQGDVYVAHVLREREHGQVNGEVQEGPETHQIGQVEV
jgi:hypothetical protein